MPCRVPCATLTRRSHRKDRYKMRGTRLELLEWDRKIRRAALAGAWHLPTLDIEAGP